VPAFFSVWYLDRTNKVREIQVKLDPIPKNVKKNKDFFRHWRKSAARRGKGAHRFRKCKGGRPSPKPEPL